MRDGKDDSVTKPDYCVLLYTDTGSAKPRGSGWREITFASAGLDFEPDKKSKWLTVR